MARWNYLTEHHCWLKERLCCLAHHVVPFVSLSFYYKQCIQENYISELAKFTMKAILLIARLGSSIYCVLLVSGGVALILLPFGCHMRLDGSNCLETSLIRTFSTNLQPCSLLVLGEFCDQFSSRTTGSCFLIVFSLWWLYPGLSGKKL